jgi:DNA ligase-1
MDVLKPKTYNDFDPTGWWMAEKYDGVRAEWQGHGLDNTFRSRNDKLFYVPRQMIREVPSTPWFARLSGEFWLGRGQFQKCVSIVRNQDEDMEQWRKIQYRIFDMPIDGYTFEERQQHLHERSYNMPHWMQPINWTECRSEDHFHAFKNGVLTAGGEGVVLMQAGSLYEAKRSSTCWKWTPTYTDEACVTGHTPGTGKHEGKVGALEVCHVNGMSFKVGTGLSDEQRENPPRIGAIITYSYKGLTTAGKPRFPAFVEVRDYE